MERRLKLVDRENSESPNSKIFRIINKWGIANNFVYCDEEFNLHTVFGTEDGNFEVGVYQCRFSKRLYQQGLKEGCIVDIIDVAIL